MKWQSQPLAECIERVKYEAKIPRSQFLQAGPYPIVSQEANFINGFWDKSVDLFKLDRPVVVFGDHTQVLKYVDFDFVIGADGVKILKPRSFLAAKYLYYFLKSISLKRLGYARHYRVLSKIVVSYPPLTKQKRIVEQLDSIFEGGERLLTLYEKKLTTLAELKQAILRKAFAGKLTAPSAYAMQEAPE